jgi:hypothetical protein
MDGLKPEAMSPTEFKILTEGLWRVYGGHAPYDNEDSQSLPPDTTSRLAPNPTVVRMVGAE